MLVVGRETPVRAIERCFTSYGVMGLLDFFKPPPPPPPPPPVSMLSSAYEAVVASASEQPVALAVVVVLTLPLGIKMFSALLSFADEFFFIFRKEVGSRPVVKRLTEVERKRRSYRREIATLTFRALKSIAMADGVFHDEEHELLKLSQDVLTVKIGDLDQLALISPEELARSQIGKEPEKKARLLALMVHVALVDGDEHPQEIELVAKYAAAFGIEPETLKELRNTVMEHHATNKDKLSHSELPALAENCSAILFASPEFNSLLMSLCHR